MLAASLILLTAGWAVQAADDHALRNVHAAVAFVRTGERTPMISRGSKKLTALGAHQMHTLGQMLRGRYMGDEAYTGLGHDPIDGLSPDMLDPSQLYIQTLDRPYLQASAQALLQGLYPPYSLNSTGVGPLADATGILANGTAIDYPMSGYQYAPIKVLGDNDPWSIFLDGIHNCPLAMQESLEYRISDEFVKTNEASESLYQSLDTSLFDGIYREQDIAYSSAIPIYDYLSYAYMHDQSTFEQFNTTDSTLSGALSELKYLADESAWYHWGNSTSSSSTRDDLRAMAGKPLSALILGQFQKFLQNRGTPDSQPLTLLFGDHEPFVSLFSLLQLDTLTTTFRAMPPFASAIVFELFSIGDGENTAVPERLEDLWINFHFQNGTDFHDDLIAYPIFGKGRSRTDIPWLEFQDFVFGIMTAEVAEWCRLCNSTAIFCTGVYGGNVEDTVQGIIQRTKEKVPPTVAGVIGAVVALVVAGLLFATAMLLGGVRLQRVEGRRESGLGGFKGSAKLASDPDLSLAKHAAVPAGAAVVGHGKPARERVGSWELRQKEVRQDAGRNGDLAEQSPRGSFEAIEAAMRRPVEPIERV